jgi:hypothetical protein
MIAPIMIESVQHYKVLPGVEGSKQLAFDESRDHCFDH